MRLLLRPGESINCSNAQTRPHPRIPPACYVSRLCPSSALLPPSSAPYLRFLLSFVGPPLLAWAAPAGSMGFLDEIPGRSMLSSGGGGNH